MAVEGRGSDAERPLLFHVSADAWLIDSASGNVRHPSTIGYWMAVVPGVTVSKTPSYLQENC